MGAVPMTVVLAVVLSGCVGGTAENAPTGAQATTAQAPSPDSTTSASSPAPAGITRPIIIEFGDQQIAGELDDSAASASLIDQLPLTLSFRDHGGQEKIAVLPAPLNLEGAPNGSDAAPLTIGYYVPEQGLVLYYENVGYYAGIVPIGTFENADAVRGHTSEFTVTIRQAQ
ncbi:hypothetical protein F8G81_10600 [Arthrobacter sp. CDRTa11]|uniref:cyclophilin-like fold protein n=1 Tax=Arthrobacter sp. CDRTa11 TaxID=2651199 RepID=UPI002265CAA3|nr:cyclophilin-like fold protein [Arthrobacter sp. CDRTa11]UZX02997.1 hypothetical protein F8G81_10600 [Arthrobacter sp. CDRTa11]